MKSKHHISIILALLVIGIIFISGCIQPPKAPSQPKAGVDYIDDLGCFPKGCDLPPGMKELCQDFEKGEISWPGICSEMREEACQALCEREKQKIAEEIQVKEEPVVEKFEPKELDYIAEHPEKTGRKLVFGVGMHDLWGRFCFGENSSTCEDNTKFIASSMERVKSIGSELVMVTDFAVLNKDLSISRSHPLGAIHEMSEADLKEIKERAGSGQKVMLVTNLVAEPEVREIANYDAASNEKAEMIFSGWKKVIVENAKKAENAGVDYLVLNPADFQLDYFKSTELVNSQYAEILAEVRKNFNGKVCSETNIGLLSSGEMPYAKELDCVIDNWGLPSILKDASEDADSIEESWASYLSGESFKKLKGKEIFVLMLVPSYDGAIKKGWIEPGQGYAEGTYERDWKEQALVYEGFFRAIYSNPEMPLDGIISYGYWWTDTIYPSEVLGNGLGHSIRGKDAEQVFYQWSRIFS